MSLGAKLSLAFAAMILAAILAGWMVYSTAQQAFDQLDQQRTKAVLAHLEHLFLASKAQVHGQIEQLANSEAIQKMLVTRMDASVAFEAAAKAAETHRLDFIELIADDGSIIACFPGGANTKNTWVLQSRDWQTQEPFLRLVEESKDSSQLGLMAVRMIIAAERHFWVIGGKRLGQEFLATLSVPTGMRVLLYLNPEVPSVGKVPVSSFGPVASAVPLEGIVSEVRRQGKEASHTIVWNGTSADAERIHALPLRGRENELLAVALLCNSQRELASVTGMISNLGLVLALLLLPLGLFGRWWTKRRVSRPLQKLAEGFRQVGSGNWRFRVHTHSSDEIGQIGHAFNRMTRKLAAHGDRIQQSERVSAWRDLTRQLAHHFQGPLSSMQASADRISQAAEQGAPPSDAIRQDSAALLSQLKILQTMLRCLNEFSSIPSPQRQPVDISELASRMLQEFDAQLQAAVPPIRVEALLERDMPKVMADPELLTRVLQGLVLNAMDAMLEGGVLKVQTQRTEAGVSISVSDTGRGWSQEEMKELFVGSNPTEPEGAGWGIAIVQSVVNDIDGHVSVESSPGKGTRIQIELPRAPSSK